MSRPIYEFARDLLKEEDESRAYSFDCYIYFFEKVISVEYYLDHRDLDWDHSCQRAIFNLMFVCADSLSRRDDYKNAFLYTSVALRTDDYYLLRKAFNSLGYCALRNKEFQLAYDVLFSWINCKLLNSLKRTCNLDDRIFKEINKTLKSQDLLLRKEKDIKWQGLVIDNFTYLVTEIIGMLPPSQDRDILFFLAQYYIDQAIENDANNVNLYYYKGVLLLENKAYFEAYRCFNKSISSGLSVADTTNTYRHIMSALQNIYSDRLKKEFDSASENYLASYQELLNDDAEHYEVVNGRDLFVLLSKCEGLTEDNKSLKYDLFEIDNTTKKILDTLRKTPKPFSSFNVHFSYLSDDVRQSVLRFTSNKRSHRKNKKISENEIAYYTTLDILSYLFSDVTIDEIICEEEEKQEKKDCKENKSIKLNCLTMMHARYMNDPEEGLVLFESLKDYFYETPETLREMLYDQKYVFLKSFTGLVDQLNMWTMYGSDRKKNKDCDGCCVCLAPESFAPGSIFTDKLDSKVWKHFNENYDLYNVAYLDGEKVIVKGERSKAINDLYAVLKRQIGDLHTALDGAPDNDVTIINDCLVRILEKLVFLFKKGSYSQEAESRIILSRDINDRLGIRRTPKNPDNPLEPRKLFINPPFQVYVKKIILGPKLENPDYWIPHLQYELSKIHDKWVYGEEKDYIPKVRLSNIKIR